MNDHLERDKQNVKAFYDLMFNQCKRPKLSSCTSAANTFSTIPE
jgi:hypothetical protein